MARTLYALALAAQQQEKPWHTKPGRRAASCNRHRQRALAAVLAAAVSALPLARAAMPPDTHVFDHAAVVPDAELADMRGKFVAAGQVMYFGVEMVTQWLSASGQAITASGILQVSLAGDAPQIRFTPHITVEQRAATAGPAGGSFAAAGGAGGLQDVQGVVQNIQVAGASNGITNTIGINVNASPAAPEVQPAPGGSLTASTTTAGGSVATVGLGADGMKVAVMVPDQGRAVQQIHRTGMVGGQVLQSVQLGGDVNQIQNRINLNVQMNPGAGPASQAGNMLLGLKMIPQRGTF